MGDILWAHLEMLQKEVEREKVHIQNIPSGFSDSFSNEANFAGNNRTYIQLDSTTSSSAVSSTNGHPQPALPPLLPSTSEAIAIAAQQANVSSKMNFMPQNSISTPVSSLQYSNQAYQHRPLGSSTSVTSSLAHNPIAVSSAPSESWNHTGSNAGSIADGSEYSYHGSNANVGSIANTSVEMKYSHQMAVAAVTSAASRVPQIPHNGYPMTQYPSYHEYDTNLWTNPNHPVQQNPYQQHQQSHQLILNEQHNPQSLQPSSNQWHQPTSTSSDFHSVSNGKPVSPASSTTISPPLGLNSLSNHIHSSSISGAGSQQIVAGTGMHQHPAFLQVRLASFEYTFFNCCFFTTRITF